MSVVNDIDYGKAMMALQDMAYVRRYIDFMRAREEGQCRVIAKLNQDKEQQNQELDARGRRIVNLEEENKKLHGDVVIALERSGKLEADQMKQLKERLSELEGRNSELSRTVCCQFGEVRDLKERLRLSNLANEELTRANINFLDREKALTKENAQLTNANNELEREVNLLLADEHVIELKDVVRILSTDKVRLTDELTKAGERIQELEGWRQELREQNARLTNANTSLRQERDEARDGVARRSERIENLEAMNSRLEGMVRDQGLSLNMTNGLLTELQCKLDEANKKLETTVWCAKMRDLEERLKVAEDTAEDYRELLKNRSTELASALARLDNIDKILREGALAF